MAELGTAECVSAPGARRTGRAGSEGMVEREGRPGAE